MIEMQWVSAPLQTPIQVGVFEAMDGASLKLQFREVVRRAPELGGSIETAPLGKMLK